MELSEFDYNLPKIMFNIITQSKISSARIGKLKTLHGAVQTPFFMPIATKGAVKNLTSQEVKELGFEVILANTFHLLIKPGNKILKKAGGLHKLIGWQGPILTDSGGFQVFSLAKIRKIRKDGVEFVSLDNGGKVLLSPEKALECQKAIGSDLQMVLDECPGSNQEKQAIEKAVGRTFEWAQKSKFFFQKQWRGKNKKPLLFGIIQGGVYSDLRKKSLQGLLKLGFDGYALGGLAVGEPQSEMFKILKVVCPLLPEKKPRYLMGAGFPEQIVKAIKMGIDMFDCVLPTRNARHGELFVFNSGFWQVARPFQADFYQILKISKSKYDSSLTPIDKNCKCYTCKNFSLAYLHHLYKVKEPLYQRLATLHNLRFYSDLMQKIKSEIKQGRF